MNGPWSLSSGRCYAVDSSTAVSSPATSPIEPGGFPSRGPTSQLSYPSAIEAAGLRNDLLAVDGAAVALCGLQLELRADHADGLVPMPNRISMGLTALSPCINLATGCSCRSRIRGGRWAPRCLTSLPVGIRWGRCSGDDVGQPSKGCDQRP